MSTHLRQVSAAGVVTLGGALTGTCVAVSTHDGLFFLLPLLSCMLAGVIQPRYRSAWLPPVGFLVSFFGTIGLWMLAGTIPDLTGFHALNYTLAVLGIGAVAAAAGTFLSNRPSVQSKPNPTNT